MQDHVSPLTATAIVMSRRIVAVISLLCLSCGTPLMAGGDILWVGYQADLVAFPFPQSFEDGSFFHGDCWLNYLVPGPEDTAIFGASHTMGNNNDTHAPHTIHF